MGVVTRYSLLSITNAAAYRTRRLRVLYLDWPSRKSSYNRCRMPEARW